MLRVLVYSGVLLGIRVASKKPLVWYEHYVITIAFGVESENWDAMLAQSGHVLPRQETVVLQHKKHCRLRCRSGSAQETKDVFMRSTCRVVAFSKLRILVFDVLPVVVDVLLQAPVSFGRCGGTSVGHLKANKAVLRELKGAMHFEALLHWSDETSELIAEDITVSPCFASTRHFADDVVAEVKSGVDELVDNGSIVGLAHRGNADLADDGQIAKGTRRLRLESNHWQDQSQTRDA
jgi:hypothetical protein